MPEQKIPVSVITGFLGSGKTTLLNRMLADGVKTAVVINEFGETPIDQDLLQEQNIPLTVLSGGCLCCQVKGALAPTLKNLWMSWSCAAEKPFQRVLIETSGVASPEPVLDTLLREPWLSKRYRLAHIVTTLAIPSALHQLQGHAEARAQVAWADALVLTHRDWAEADHLQALEQSLQQLAPATPRFTVESGGFDPALLSEVSQPLFRRLPVGESPREHAYRSLSLYFEQAPSWPDLQAALLELLSKYREELVRIKGVVFPPERAQPLVIQVAAGRWYPAQPLPSANWAERRSRLVFIATADMQQLVDDLLGVFGSSVKPNAIRLHH